MTLNCLNSHTFKFLHDAIKMIIGDNMSTSICDSITRHWLLTVMHQMNQLRSIYLEIYRKQILLNLETKLSENTEFLWKGLLTRVWTIAKQPKRINTSKCFSIKFWFKSKSLKIYPVSFPCGLLFDDWNKRSHPLWLLPRLQLPRLYRKLGVM